MRCGGGGGIRTPADRYQPGLFSRQLRSTTPAPLRRAVYRMRGCRSAEVLDVVGPVRATLLLDQLLQGLALQGGEGALIKELRLAQ